MKCSACQSENRANAKFCRGCGATMLLLAAPCVVACTADNMAPPVVPKVEFAPQAVACATLENAGLDDNQYCGVPIASTVIMEPEPFYAPTESKVTRRLKSHRSAGLGVASGRTRFFSVWHFAPALAKSRRGDLVPALPMPPKKVTPVKRPKIEIAQQPKLTDEEETRIAVQQLQSMLKQPVMETTRELPTPVIPLVLAPPSLDAPCVVLGSADASDIEQGQQAPSMLSSTVQPVSHNQPTCQECERPFRQTDIFCVHCGSKITPRGLFVILTCPECRCPASAEHKFCTNCGYDVRGISAVADADEAITEAAIPKTAF